MKTRDWTVQVPEDAAIVCPTTISIHLKDTDNDGYSDEPTAITYIVWQGEDAPDGCLVIEYPGWPTTMQALLAVAGEIEKISIEETIARNLKR